MELNKDCFQDVDRCPWCGNNDNNLLYSNSYEAEIKECIECGFVFSDKILNEKGLKLYWSNYSSQVHDVNDRKVRQREIMYQCEFDYIRRFQGTPFEGLYVLDVGCGSGGMLKLFKKDGAQCYGIEYGEEAANEAEKVCQIKRGLFPKIEIKEKFDWIVFRGSLQYCIEPQRYLRKAVELLNDHGKLFITSSPNADSICFKLFKENFIIPVGVTEYYAFKEELLSNFLRKLGVTLVNQHFFYKETPYANINEDILKVSEALKLANNGEKIHFKSPAFWDNMLSLIYEKTANIEKSQY